MIRWSSPSAGSRFRSDLAGPNALDIQGWQTYNGGGRHNLASISGGHYELLHVTVKAGDDGMAIKPSSL
ncbi:hypothetical protein [Actinomyces weissii]|uniref:Uncharacterized protein n=1 Tax=Actinomyces weissii TaxID=675090 RepID=A0A7T7S2T7_9ACTO|nr:hypothetical protein [Actinomyces weissii]QQM67947.1 hypothetical protein JG540_03540 [Actinomyces weissii]